MDELSFPSLHWLPLNGSDLLTIEKFFRLYPEAVVKPVVGQGGWGVEALTWERFRSWQKKKGSDQDYLLQPLIKGGQELRYFFIKDSWSCVLERTSPSGVAANFQQQGKAKPGALPDKFRPTIEQIIHQSGLIYGAVDLIIDGDHLYVLELNAVPGIEQLEKISGENVITRLAAKFFCQDY
jgi:glutathione synthase/RimK-type ligase-like ATP-grasp enzyme